jgi:hypothetical protein
MAVVEVLNETAIIGCCPARWHARAVASPRAWHDVRCPQSKPGWVKVSLRMYACRSGRIGTRGRRRRRTVRRSFFRRSPLSREPHNDVGRHDLGRRCKYTFEEAMEIVVFWDQTKPFVNHVLLHRSSDTLLQDASGNNNCPAAACGGTKHSRTRADPLEPVRS